jgi:hypothetical protein
MRPARIQPELFSLQALRQGLISMTVQTTFLEAIWEHGIGYL